MLSVLDDMCNQSLRGFLLVLTLTCRQRHNLGSYMNPKAAARDTMVIVVEAVTLKLAVKSSCSCRETFLGLLFHGSTMTTMQQWNQEAEQPDLTVNKASGLLDADICYLNSY